MTWKGEREEGGEGGGEGGKEAGVRWEWGSLYLEAMARMERQGEKVKKEGRQREGGREGRKEGKEEEGTGCSLL